MPTRDYSATIQEGFAAALRALRTERGLSQEELGFEADVHRTYIGELERGEKTPTIAMLAKVARPLGLRPSELLAAAESHAVRRGSAKR